MSAAIKDGTGKGYVARVNANNQLVTFAETRTEFEQQVIKGRAFCVGSGVLAYSITADSALFRIENTSNTDSIVIVDVLTDRINLATAGTAAQVELVGGVTGFSGAETELTLVNRKFGDAFSFPVRAFAADSVGQTFLNPALFPLTSYVLPPGTIDNKRASTYALLAPGGSAGVRISGVGGAMTGGQIAVAMLGYVVDLEG
jgi:hypothetical protein